MPDQQAAAYITSSRGQHEALQGAPILIQRPPDLGPRADRIRSEDRQLRPRVACRGCSRRTDVQAAPITHLLVAQHKVEVSSPGLPALTIVQAP